MSSKKSSSGQTRTSTIVATPAGLARELIFWPALIVAVAFTALFGADPMVTLGAGMIAMLIVNETDGRQRQIVCWVMVMLGFINAWHVHYPTPEVFTHSGYWFAYRVLYGLVPAFCLPHLLKKWFEKRKGRDATIIIIATSLLYLAFVALHLTRPSDVVRTVQCVQVMVETSTCVFREPAVAFYTPEMLYDDVLTGTAFGLIVFAITGSIQRRKAGQARRS